MTLSQGTASPGQSSSPTASAMANDTLPKETCSRVRKACNRCRLRKVKCNGRIPCSRCEQDHATCRINHDITGLKDLRKSYIASLEEQQIFLLSAIKDLREKVPHNPDVRDTIQQLERKGFDIDSLRFRDPHIDPQPAVPTPDPCSSESWESPNLTTEYLQSLLEQPAPQAVMSNCTWADDTVDSRCMMSQSAPGQPVRWEPPSDYFPVAPLPSNLPLVEPLTGRWVNHHSCFTAYRGRA